MSDDGVSPDFGQVADHGCERREEDLRNCFDMDDGYPSCNEADTNKVGKIMWFMSVVQIREANRIPMILVLAVDD